MPSRAAFGIIVELKTVHGANQAYDAIIQRELEGNGHKDDHFASAGKNSRIWNRFSKHALESPRNFVDYFSNLWFKVVCEAYRGSA